MSALKVPLSDITEEGIPIDVSVTADAIRPEGAEEFGVGKVRVSGTLAGDDGMYTFDGTVSGAFEGPCDRCPKDVTWPFSIRVIWTFLESEPDVPDEDWATGVVDDSGISHSTTSYGADAVDLTRQTWEEVSLALPSKFPPLDEDKTHCLACGEAIEKFLPKQEEKELKNKGLAGLKDMFPDLPPGKE